MTDEKEPKIIVDDDWKSQVEKEKEELQQQRQVEDDEPQLPEASFSILVTTLATQTISALGFVPHPETGQPEINKPMAKHFIDTLGMLQEKTAGNLADEESKLLEESLHQLRMAYVAAESAGQADDADSETPTSSIELP